MEVEGCMRPSCLYCVDAGKLYAGNNPTTANDCTMDIQGTSLSCASKCILGLCFGSKLLTRFASRLIEKLKAAVDIAAQAIWW